MGIHPEDTDLLSPRAGVGRDARDRPRGNRMVTAQYERKMPAAHDTLHPVGEESVGACNLGEVPGVWVSDPELLDIPELQVSFIQYGAAESAERIPQAGDTNGGGPHIHPTAPGPEVHGDADDVNGSFAARHSGEGKK
jgi:hypothetical protein